MKALIKATLLAAACLSSPLHADMALGKARGEPLMILAAIRMRSTLGGEAPSMATGLTSREDAIAEARKLAKGNKALLGIVEDVASAGSRRMCIYSRNGVCY